MESVFYIYTLMGRCKYEHDRPIKLFKTEEQALKLYTQICGLYKINPNDIGSEVELPYNPEIDNKIYTDFGISMYLDFISIKKMEVVDG